MGFGLTGINDWIRPTRCDLGFRNVVSLVVDLVPPVFTFLSIFLSDALKQEEIKELSPCQIALFLALSEFNTLS